MKNKRVDIFKLILLATLCSVFSAVLFACTPPAQETVDSDFTYLVNEDNSITITGYNQDKLGGEVEIPLFIEEKPVKKLKNSLFSNNETITSISLPCFLTSIPDDAFYNCANLEEVIFKGKDIKLEAIGSYAFYGCKKLKKFNAEVLNKLVIPSKVKNIGVEAFNGAVFDEVEFLSQIEYIADTSFRNCKNVKKFTAVENSYIMVDDGVLYNKYGSLMQYPLGKTAADFTIPTSVANITINNVSLFAFYNEAELESVNLNGIKAIAESAFENCERLLNVEGVNVELILKDAFKNTAFSKKTDKFLTLGKVLYKYNGSDVNLAENDFPKNVERISNGAFYNNQALKSIVLPLRVEGIDEFSFNDCTNLESIKYYNNVLPSIQQNSFYNLADNFKFYAKKSVIDSVEITNNWYAFKHILVPIATKLYFEGLNRYETYYYGELVTLPEYKVLGKKFKGWLIVDESNNMTYGEYLNSNATWSNVSENLIVRADLEDITAYTVNFINGSERVGSLHIGLEDNYTFSQFGYEINDSAYKNFSGYFKMEKCYYGAYIGYPIIEGAKVATFKGWTLDGNLIESSGEWKGYTDPIVELCALWEPIEFTATFNEGELTSVEFNYFDGLELPTLEKEGYIFIGWKDEEGVTYPKGTYQFVKNKTFTANWQRILN